MKRTASYVLLLLMMATSAIAQAQPDGRPGPPSPERMNEIRAQKAAYITSKLSLTPEEAQRFWPVYNKYDEEIEALRRELGGADRELRAKGDALTEADASAFLEKEIGNRQKEVDIMRKLQGESRKLIGAKRTVELGRAERDFHREVLRRFKDGPRGGTRGSDRKGDQPGKRN